MSSMPKIVSNVTFTGQQMMSAVIKPLTHTRQESLADAKVSA